MPVLSSFLLIQSTAISMLGLAVLLVVSPITVLSSTTLSLLGSSMHVRPATFIPHQIPVTAGGLQGQTTNPLTSLTRSIKTSLTVPERELLSLLGLVIGAAAFSTIILAFPLRFNKERITSRSTEQGKMVRKASPEVGEAIASLNLVQNLWQVFAGLHVVIAAAAVAWMYVFQRQKGAAQGSQFVDGLNAASLLANDVTFTICFCDMLFWGYLYTTIKEEKRIVLEIAEKRRTEDDEDEANRAM